MYHGTERGGILCLFSDPTESKSSQNSIWRQKMKVFVIRANVCMSFIYLHYLATLCFFLTHCELPCLGRKNLCMLLTSKQVYKLIQRAVILKIFLCLMCTAAKLLFLYKLIYCISDRCLCLGNFISQSGKMRPNSCNLLCPICHWNSNCLFPIIQGAIWRN